MAERFLVADLQRALLERTLPTVTVFNRLEGRPRTRAFDRALKAEVRDALWMLTRQWQMGELHGDDAGSPLLAKLQLGRTELTRYRPREHDPEPFDDALPLEARAERRPVVLELGDRPLALDLRLLMGRRWLRLVADLGDHRDAYIAAYGFEEPDPSDPADADRAAHPAVWQALAAVAGRAMDGGALYLHLKASSGNHAYDGVAGIPASSQGDVDERAERFVAWFEQLLRPPAAPDRDAWDPQRLEYRFTCSAPRRAGGQKAYVAEEHHGGPLDWWSFDVDRQAEPLEGGDDPAVPVVDDPATLMPAAVVFEGMPSTRWWAFEDRRTNLGDVDAATTDVAKLLFLEFALVYANDWFIVPADLPYGSIAEVRGIAVTNVFGERTWVEPAGAGPDEDWQRWSMFTVAVRGESPDAADTDLLLLPTVPKVQEGEPLEEIVLIRDEMANMVWGVERLVPLADGASRPGAEASRETLAFFRRLAGAAPAPPPGRVADVRYEVMTTVPEHWIPFLPVHVKDDLREIQLQRAALPRIVEGAPGPPAPVRPRTALLREGLDAVPAAGYVLHEEEVPREGTAVAQAFQRARWRGGRAVTWVAAHRQTGRGEGSSGLAFDQLVDVPPEA